MPILPLPGGAAHAAAHLARFFQLPFSDVVVGYAALPHLLVQIHHPPLVCEIDLCQQCDDEETYACIFDHRMHQSLSPRPPTLTTSDGTHHSAIHDGIRSNVPLGVFEYLQGVLHLYSHKDLVTTTRVTSRFHAHTNTTACQEISRNCTANNGVIVTVTDNINNETPPVRRANMPQS